MPTACSQEALDSGAGNRASKAGRSSWPRRPITTTCPLARRAAGKRFHLQPRPDHLQGR